MLEAPIAAVIWDMDGLLLDTERLSHESWVAAALEMGLQADPAVFLQIIGMNRASIEEALLRLIGRDLDVAELYRRVARIYEQRLEGGPPLKPGAARAVELLASRRFPQAVATSSRRSVAERKLGHHGMLAKLGALVGGDEVARGKPDAEPFLRAAELLGVAPAHCIVFEDSINGVLGAHRAGMRPILVPDLVDHPPESAARAWKRFDSLDAAYPLLDEISRA